jgi:putative transposase
MHALKRFAYRLVSSFSDRIDAKAERRWATCRKAYLGKWRLKCRGGSEKSGEQILRVFTVTALALDRVHDDDHRKRLHRESNWRVKTRTILPPAKNRHIVPGATHLRGDHAKARSARWWIRGSK